MIHNRIDPDSQTPTLGTGSHIPSSDPPNNIPGNAGTATKLATPRDISGVAFDGSTNITLTANDIGAAPSAHNQAWSTITSGKPTTLSGYGITDALPATGTAAKTTNMVGGNSTTQYGSIPCQSGTDTTMLVYPNTSTSRKFLRMTGTGTNGASPTWDDLWEYKANSFAAIPGGRYRVQGSISLAVTMPSGNIGDSIEVLVMAASNTYPVTIGSDVFYSPSGIPVVFRCTGGTAWVIVPNIIQFSSLDGTSAAISRVQLGVVGLTGDQTVSGIKTFSGAVLNGTTTATAINASALSVTNVPTFSALTRASVYLSAGQTTMASNYDTVKFDAVLFGTGFNTTANAYVSTATGYLRITGAIGVATGPTGGYFIITVFKGNPSPAVSNSNSSVKVFYSSNGYMQGTITPFSTIIPVTSGDSVTIRVYSSPAASLTTGAQNTWCIFELLPN